MLSCYCPGYNYDNSGSPCTAKEDFIQPASQEVTGFREFRVSGLGSLGFRVFGSLGFRVFGSLGFRVFGSLGFWV